MYNVSIIGSRIKERRKALGMTQKALAAKISPGVRPEEAPHLQISQWEHGKNIPGTDALARLCNALECDMDYLLGAIDTPRRSTYDVIAQTGLSAEAVQRLQWMQEQEANAGLDLLSALISDRQFLGVLQNLNYARFAAREASRPMSDSLQRELLMLQVANWVEQHPGATVFPPEQVREMNLYRAAQKFSECAERITRATQDKRE